MDAYDQRVIAEYRQRGGGTVGGLPLLLLHTVGAKTGVDRVTPLVYWRVDDRALAVLASNHGAPTHPHWYRNLVADPLGTVELGAETWRVQASVAAPDRRRLLLARMADPTGSVAAALGNTRREIPLVVLELLSRVQA